MRNAVFLSQAIASLRPNSEFTFYGEDYLSIQWFKLEGEPPTLEEVEQEVQNQKILFETKQEQRQAAKNSAQIKLQALGLTELEIKALIG
jgi:glycerophosphoryl diester phosphodiesterase